MMATLATHSNGGGLLDDRWLSDNIISQVGDGASTLF
jgi:hypothetical protein